MWTYVFGPFLSLLPETWRARLPWAESIRWRPATFISGALEAVVSLCALVVWYSYSVTRHTPVQLDSALRAHPNVHPNEMMMGLLGYVFVALNPVTWIIGWFWFEGVVRALGAAFTEEIVGTLPLWIIDKSYRVLRQRHQNRHRPPLVPDEVTWLSGGQAEVLEITSCQPKPTWQDRPTIRFKDEFFKVERSIAGTGLRPYIYQLRRLQLGEIIRAPENYDPEAVSLEPQREKNVWASAYRALRKR
jgi:hypothetical protein